MKAQIISVLLFFSALTPLVAGNTQQCYFCANKGAVLEYERRTPESGIVWWRHVLRINEVTQKASGDVDVAFSSEFLSEEVKSPVEGPVPASVTISKSGDVLFDIAAAAASVIRKMFKALSFKTEGGRSTLKATNAPGDMLPDIHAVISWGIFDYKIDYTERKILRHEIITVPAGTFDCIVVSERKLERRPLYKNDRNTLTWYALGYGLVRHDTFFRNGKLESTEELVSARL